MTHPWIEGSIDFLARAYDPERARFSYSSSLTPTGFTNDFSHPAVIRYSINSLLGLQEAKRCGETGPAIASFDEMLESFLDRNLNSVTDRADKGLLLVLLAGEQAHSETSARIVGELTRAVDADDLKDADLQTIAWMLWGLARATEAGHDRAGEVARKLFLRLHSHYLDKDSLFARHSLQRYRKDLVSFGGTVYYLRALHEYGRMADDEYALTLFDWGVRRVMGLQGPMGEWPWMISVGRASIVDAYPVFSVHQDSMAMLFLLPALDRGIEGVRAALANSCAWVEGRNELGIDLVNRDPFFISRSIQRRERNPRARRYVRQLRPAGSIWPAAGRDKVEVNPECRSYHIGWILFVWTARQDLLEESLALTPGRAT